MITDPKFFSAECNENGLYRDAAEFKHALPLNVNTAFSSLAPCLARVEQEYILPILGDSLFDDLSMRYSRRGGDSDMEIDDNIISLIQNAEVRLALWDSYDQLAVTFSDRGATDNSGENRLYRYQSDQMRTSFRRQGFDNLNAILKYLEDHIDSFPKFQDSTYYSGNATGLISNAREFSNIYQIGNSFLFFHRMKDYLRMTEQLELPHRIGQSLSTALISSKRASDTSHVSISDRFQPILRSIQEWIIYTSLADAAVAFGILPTSTGFVYLSERSSQGITSTPPTDQQLNNMSRMYISRADRYMANAIDYMQSHINLYPELSEVGGTTAPRSNVIIRNNRGKRSFFA